MQRICANDIKGNSVEAIVSFHATWKLLEEGPVFSTALAQWEKLA